MVEQMASPEIVAEMSGADPASVANRVRSDPRSRFQFRVRDLMLAVALVALLLLGAMELNTRYGTGAPYWREAKRMAHIADICREKAEEYRECPQDYSPGHWRHTYCEFPGYGAYSCLGCVEYGWERIRRREHLSDSAQSFDDRSPEARGLFLEAHQKLASAAKHDARVCERLRDLYLQKARRPGLPLPSFSEDERNIASGLTFWEEYRPSAVSF